MHRARLGQHVPAQDQRLHLEGAGREQIRRPLEAEAAVPEEGEYREPDDLAQAAHPAQGRRAALRFPLAPSRPQLPRVPASRALPPRTQLQPSTIDGQWSDCPAEATLRAQHCTSWRRSGSALIIVVVPRNLGAGRTAKIVEWEERMQARTADWAHWVLRWRPPSGGPHRPRAETMLRVVMNSDLKIVDPIWTTVYVTRNHGYMIYDTLFALDGKREPQAADGRRVLGFRRRPHLHFRRCATAYCGTTAPPSRPKTASRRSGDGAPGI